MPIALTPRETFEYQLVEDRLPDGKLDPSKTIFVLKPLTVDEEAELENATFDVSFKGEVHGIKLGSALAVRFRLGVKSWRNFKDAAGQVVEFNPANFDRLSIAHRVEIANAHREHYSLTTTEGN